MADGVWKGVNPQVFGHSRQLSPNKFLIRAILQLEDFTTQEKNEKKGGRKKLKMFLVATNVIASQPPERRSTGTPHARAKKTTVQYQHQPKTTCNNTVTTFLWIP